MAENVTNITTVVAETPMQLEKYIISALDIIICVFGLFGNCLSMVVVVNDPGLKMASTVFIFNLALADFLFLLSLPFTVANILVGHWMFGEPVCKIYYGLFGINLFASVYTLVVMSFDRYIAVCRIKWRNMRTWSNSIICCVIIWITATLFTLPLWLFSQLDTKKGMCMLEWPTENAENSAQAYIFYTLILGFVLPLFLITIFYVSIVARLRERSTENVNAKKKKRTRKVTVAVFFIIMAFVLCWLPYWCIQLVILVDSSQENPSPIVLVGYQVATLLSNCNSAINPILYGFLSNKFRQAVVQLFKCEVRPRDSPSHSSRLTTILNTMRIQKRDKLSRRGSRKALRDQPLPLEVTSKVDEVTSLKRKTSATDVCV